MRVSAIFRIGAALCALAAVALVAPSIVEAVNALTPDHLVVGAPLLMGSVLALPAPFDVPTLNTRRSAPPGGFEAIEDVLFDTVTYPAAGLAANGRLEFFQNAANTSDKSLTNFDQPGFLQHGQYFHARRVFVDFLTEPSVTAAETAAGRLADVEKILNTSRARLEIFNSRTNRTRNGIPLRMIGGSGGATGIIGGNNTAPHIIQQARNHAHGGFPVDLIISGGETIKASIVGGPATAISADLPIVVMFYGWRYIAAG